MNPGLGPHLRISLPKPGFFLTDCRFTILLDGYVIYDGSFLSGVDVAVRVQPGWHTVETKIDFAMATRSKNYSVEIHEGPGAMLLLEYSRFWGNFASKPKVVPL